MNKSQKRKNRKRSNPYRMKECRSYSHKGLAKLLAYRKSKGLI